MAVGVVQSASLERVRFERRVVDAGTGAAALVVNIINVTLGNVMDQLLPLVAERVAGVVRTGDEITRIGAQQLALVLDTRTTDLAAVGLRVEESVETASFTLDGSEYHLHASVSHATVAEAGPDGPLLLALDRNHARVQEIHRRIFHEGPFNGGRGGGTVDSMHEWAELALESSLDPQQFGCEAARFEFDGQVWEGGEVPDRPAEFDIDFEVARQVRGRMRSWKPGPVLPPAFLASARAYFNELAERLVALEASRVDDLTGLANRAGLRHRLERGTVTAIALVDLDRFKVINDEHGYATGDRVLCCAATLLEEQCAPATVGRWGGEEFVVATDRDAVWLADRLASALELCLRRPPAGEPMVTFSAGVTTVPGNEWLDALPIVNDALKRAKIDRASIVTVTP